MSGTPTFGRRAAANDTIDATPSLTEESGSTALELAKEMAPEPPPSPRPSLPAALNIPPRISAPSPDEALREVRRLCLTRIEAAAVANLAPDRLRSDLERLISEIATSNRFQLNGREQRKLAEELVDDMLGLGPLQPLLDDEGIADIMVNGPTCVFVERGGKVAKTDVRFRDAAHLTGICQRIASGVGRRVDESSPMVDARLKDGSRVNIVLPPLALDGPCISIRKFGKKPIDFGRLIGFGALTAPVARILEIAGRARMNIVI